MMLQTPPFAEEEIPTREQATTRIKPGLALVNWSLLACRVQAGEELAVEELYRLLSRGIRYFLCRHLGPQDLHDKVHDTFIIILKAIRRGDVREPERMMGFVRTISHRQVTAYIEANIKSRRDSADLDTAGGAVADSHQNPEQEAINVQRMEIMKLALKTLSPRDREILTRFYLNEQCQEQICREMELTETQYRLFKSRAKARLGEAGRKRAGTCIPVNFGNQSRTA